MYSLEGDGVCEHLYEFVWCKDELSFRPSINIPDTIVYKFGQPVSWYFTGVDGKVKKKFKTNIINGKIEEAFVKANVGSDIVAYYISWTSGTPKYQDGEYERAKAPRYIFQYTRYTKKNHTLDNNSLNMAISLSIGWAYRYLLPAAILVGGRNCLSSPISLTNRFREICQ